MSQDIPRRPLLIALGAVVGVGIVGGGLYESGLIGRHPRSPKGYEDLLSGLGDRDTANRLGQAVLDEGEAFDASRVAHDLRKQRGHRPLTAVLADDLAQDRLVEVKGWVLPESLTQLCALSAKLG